MYYEAKFEDNLPESKIKRQAADSSFIKTVLKECKTLDSCSRQASNRGWQFYASGDFITSIKRFNQAWLLSNQNPDAYWGMAMILDARPDIDTPYIPVPRKEYAVKLMLMAYNIDTGRVEIKRDLAYSYLKYGFDYLKTESDDKRIALDKAISIYNSIPSSVPSYNQCVYQHASACVALGQYEAGIKLIYSIRESIPPEQYNNFLVWVDEYKTKYPQP